jgi:(2Fe-2S) ferredoxin
MECLADCGQGPVVIVDEKTYEDIQGESAEKFAEHVKNGTLEKDRTFTSYEDGLAKPRKKALASSGKGAGKK